MIAISDHRPAWAAWFEEVRERAGLSGSSTSGAPRFLGWPPNRSSTSMSRSRMGYIYEGDRGVMGSEAFRRRGPDVPLRDPKRDWAPHHLYASVEGSRELGRHLARRDHLREVEADRDAYAALKRDLGGRDDMGLEAYTAGKSEFIEGTLGQEGRW